MSIPTLQRPLFEGMTTLEEFMKASMKEYEEVKETDENGLDFSNKTAMWIAYERYVESQRSDALFQDPLAHYFMEPYGKRLSDAMSIGLALSVFDPPPAPPPAAASSGEGDASAATTTPPVPKLSDIGTTIGFGLEGHVMYTAARTKLINDQVDEWIQEHPQGQVVNLGAGFDTRQYWLKSLAKASGYWEIDTESILSYKEKEMKKLSKVMDVKPLCPSYSIPMDLSKESVSEKFSSLDKFLSTTPTCWIVEGLIMYLEREKVVKLMDDIASSSGAGSLLILNFSNNTPKGPSIDEIKDQLAGNHWQQSSRLMFGDDGFSFDRYPPNKPANKQLGMATFRKGE